MKISPLLFLLPLILFLSECKQRTDCKKIAENIDNLFNNGSFNTITAKADSLRKYCPEEQYLIRKADSLVDISHRIEVDFSLTKEQIIEKLYNYKIGATLSNLAEWEKKNWLECRIINGEKKYFNRTASNLRLLKLFYEDGEKRKEAISNDNSIKFRKDHTTQVINNSVIGGEPVIPVEMFITYTLTVNPDAVPNGETIRCWLPWPKESHPRQQDVRLLKASGKDFIIAPDSAVHRSVYMEGISQKRKPTVFSISYQYRSSGQYFNLIRIKPLPYKKDSKLFKKYTSEQLPQICFTDGIRKLADSITAPGDPPAEVVRKIYMWFKENIPWTGALEYSIMPNIPEYVRVNRRGDCGMQTFLFMSMLRYKGIPVRWQSGWMVPPGSENLHDWSEVYYEGVGWVPADISYNLQLSENDLVREFYLSGIDSYRLIVNDGVAGDLFPPKKFMRSEPYDFQRGEVEWRGGNLYFDKWDYEIVIKYNE
jgi:hypothetical protein